MPSIPNSLPPEGLDPFYKALIYLGIAYFILTAITVALVTRRRAKPIRVETPVRAETRETPPSRVEHKATTFEDSKDMLANLKVEIAGAENSLVKLSELKGKNELSSKAYQVLQQQFTSKVTELTAKMNDMLKTDIITRSGSIDTGISEEEMKSIESDLEQQLLALEEDKDFLKPRTRAKTPITAVTGEKKEEVKPTKVTIEEPKHEKVAVTNPPPGATPISTVAAVAPTPVVTPAETPAAIPPPDKPAVMPPPDKPKTEMPAPTPIGMTQKASTPSAAPSPAPQAKKEAQIPSPPPKQAEAPMRATQPAAVQPDGNKEQIFAKSTSIAALRMDMLRELARLKKLINEDE